MSFRKIIHIVDTQSHRPCPDDSECPLESEKASLICWKPGLVKFALLNGESELGVGAGLMMNGVLYVRAVIS